MNEVSISRDIPGNKTVNLKGAKQVSLGTTGNEKSHFTIMLSVTVDGTKLAPLVIFKRKTKLKGLFPHKLIITANEKGWANNEIMLFWLENVCRKRPKAFFVKNHSCC